MDYSKEHKKSDEKSDSILEIEYRFRSVEIGESEIAYMNLYPNRWDLVNKIGDFTRW